MVYIYFLFFDLLPNLNLQNINMDKTKQGHSNSISRRNFLKSSLTVGAASALSFTNVNLLLGKPTPSFKLQLTISGFVDPYGVAVSTDGLIYITDAGGYCVKVFDQQGTAVNRFGQAGSGGAKFNYPQGISIDSSGELYIVDSNNGRIAIFSPEGKFKASLGEVGGYPEAFYTPKGIFLGDNIYACNTRNHRLSVFDKKSHQLIGSYGDLGDDPGAIQQGSLDYHFRQPTGVAVAADGKIYVVDSKHGEIKVLANDGKFLFRFGENGSEQGQLNFPEGICLDDEGNVYVCDTRNGRIQKFDPDGKFIALLNQGFKRPTSICIKNRQFYVVDAELKQLMKFEWAA